MVSRGTIGFIVLSAVLLAYPLLVQATSSDAIESNVSALKLVCDRVFSSLFGDDRDLVGQDRAAVSPFIDASHLLNHSSFGSGLVREGGSVRGVALFDANGDDLLDIYITHDNRPPLMNPESFDLEFGNSLLINLGVGSDGLPRFVDVSSLAGVREMGRKSHGVSVGDYDNDGRLDLYITNGLDGLITDDPQQMPQDHQRQYGVFAEGEGRNTLLHNEGNEELEVNGQIVLVPIFSDVTEAAGVGDGKESFSSNWVDIDNDGFLDLYVTNFIDLDFWGVRYPGLPARYVLGEQNTLYYNNGDGTFTDITQSAGVGGRPREQVRGSDRQNQQLAGNKVVDSNGLKVDPTGVASHHSLFFDYDRDLLPDLFVANDWNVIEIFHNNGDLTFTDVTEAAGLDIEGAWMEIGLWDYNSDSLPDLYVTNLGSGAFATTLEDENGKLLYTRYNGIFRNDGIQDVLIDGNLVPVPKFTYVSDQVRVDWSKALPPYGLTLRPECHNSLTKARAFELGEFGWGAVFPDIDNDGDQDIYWVGGLKRGDPNAQTLSLESPGRLLRNDGNGILTDISVESQVLNMVAVNYLNGNRMDQRYSEIGSGVATGDLNNDGFPDIIVINDADFTPFGHDPTNSLRDDEIVEVPSFLFINPGGDNNWIKIKLEGVQTNRAAIGAEIKVTLDNGQVLRRFILSGDVTGGQNPLIASFGLAKSRIAEVEVFWPSGIVDKIQNPDINGVLKILEGSSS